ncbi:MAG: DUF485 domain-containing protein [Micrococcus sp.]|nr:DUF485 domain-containing protein [Micrococcus sp.]
MSAHEATEPVPTAAQFRAAQASEEFGELRRTHRSFVWPMTVAFLVWYILFVLLGAYFHEFMSIRVVGYINLGLILGLAQFLTTFAITAAYVSFANKKLDPKATALRERLEAEAAAAPTDGEVR